MRGRAGGGPRGGDGGRYCWAVIGRQRLAGWSRGGLWRHPDFVRLWAGQTVSQFGSQVSQLALPLVAIVVLHATAFQVALLGTVDFLPFLLFTLPAGVWVDRLPRRPILIVADAGRALTLASIPLVAAIGSLALWQLYAVGFVAGTLTVCFDVAYQSFLPSLVERDELVEGNSKLEVSRSGAQIAGPGLAGVLIQAVTAPYAILADAASFVCSAYFLTRIRRREPKPTRDRSSRMRTEIAEGLRYVLRDARWRSLTAYVATVNFFWNLAFSIVLVYLVRRLHLSAGLIGLAFGLGNIGWLLGALFAGRLSRRFGLGPTLIAAAALGGPPVFLIPLAPRSFPIPFLVAEQMIVGASIVVYNINAISLIQALTPHRLLGRMNASRRFIVWGIIPLGSLTGGAIASTAGLRTTLFVGATGACFAFLPMAFSPLRSIRALPEPEAPPPLDELRLPGDPQVAES